MSQPLWNSTKIVTNIEKGESKNNKLSQISFLIYFHLFLQDDFSATFFCSTWQAAPIFSIQAGSFPTNYLPYLLFYQPHNPHPAVNR